MSVFKAYDIRGVVPNEIDANFALRLGRAFGTMRIRETGNAHPSIVAGRDMRISSPELAAALITGIIETGCNVVDVGLTSTPTFYFAVASYGYAGGVMISASHNPKEYNGFKLVKERSKSLGRGIGMEELKNIFDSFGGARDASGKESAMGKVKKWDNVVEEHVKYNLHDAGLLANGSSIERFTSPMKIAADTANAMGVQYLEALFAQLPQIKLVKINFNLDGTFPAHEADPLKPENCRTLQEKVVAEKADLGIATDGDGDRIFFIDNLGRVVQPAIVRGLLAQEVLMKKPGSKICYDIRPGKITDDMIREAGGVPVVTPVGHSLIKDWAVREGCAFAGESSGHFFEAREHGIYEDPIIAILYILRRMNRENVTLNILADKYARYAHSGEINFKVADAAAVLENIKKQFADGEQNFLDGITVTYKDYWFNVRASNTEPLVRLNVEALDLQTLQKHVKEISGIITAS